MLNKQEHEKMVKAVRRSQLPSQYKRTLFGNYTADTVRNMIADSLESYRKAEGE